LHQRIVGFDVSDQGNLDLPLLLVSLSTDNDFSVRSIQQLRESLEVVLVDDLRVVLRFEKGSRLSAGRRRRSRELFQSSLESFDKFGFELR